MPRKNLIYGFKLFNAVSATTSQTSEIVNVANLDSLSIHVVFTAPNDGEFIVEARNNQQENSTSPAPWYELDFGSVLTIAAETEVQIVMNQLPFTDIRVIWTPSAGAGTMTGRVTAKTLGA